MKLSEKILYCRKRAGLSQEALANQIGVSRQAISKWETADAVPEITKLASLAKAFHVTTDWLLSEDEPPSEETIRTSEPPAGQPQAPSETHVGTDWTDSLPGMIGQLIRRYGWLFGVDLAFSGIGITLVGTVAYVFRQRTIRSQDLIYSLGGYKNDTISIMSVLILVLGILLILAGTILAVYLKKKGKGDT